MSKIVYRAGEKGQADVLIRQVITNNDVSFKSLKVMGFHLLDQDKMFYPQPKKRETLQYIELDGEEVGEFSIDSTTISREAFDYSVTFAVFKGSVYNENSNGFIGTNEKITALLDFIESAKTLRMVNTYTGVVLECYYTGIKVNEEKRSHYNIKDYLEVVLTFRVPKFRKCNFVLDDFYCKVENIADVSEAQSVYPLYNIKRHNDYDDSGEPLITNIVI